jgi:hypothetical protein
LLQTAAALVCALIAPACGKKGPPLPPLVRIPAAPELTATRRGAIVDLQVAIPSANADGTRPANLQQVEVYGLTDAEGVANAELLERGTRVATLMVNAPPDPDRTSQTGDPADDLAPPAGQGLDQGAVAHVEDTLTASMFEPRSEEGLPLLGPRARARTRAYIGVGVARNGRRGPFSSRVAVPLVPAPPRPPAPSVTYTESAIVVSWPAVRPPDDRPADPDVLPSRPIAPRVPAYSHNLYDSTTDTRLTTSPVAGTRYEDTRVEWGAERCYALRVVETLGDAAIESGAGAPTCVTLVDTFPPAAPRRLQAVATAGAVNLIWEPNAEPDLAGYVVLRGVAPAVPRDRIVPAPVPDARFSDAVQPGVRYVYGVIAVDRAGNESGLSDTQEAEAR